MSDQASSLEGSDLKMECARLAVKALQARFDLMTAQEVADNTQDLAREIEEAIEWWTMWRFGGG